MKSNLEIRISGVFRHSSFGLCDSTASAERRRGSKESKIAIAIGKVLVASFRLLRGSKSNGAGKRSKTGISPFGLGFRAFSSFDLPRFFPAPRKHRGKNSPRKTLFSSRKTTFAKTPISKTLENKRKTTIGVMEKGKMKRGNSGQQTEGRRIDHDFEFRISTFGLLSSFELRHSSFHH